MPPFSTIPRFYKNKLDEVNKQEEKHSRKLFLIRKEEELQQLGNSTYQTLLKLLVQLSLPQDSKNDLDGKTLSYPSFVLLGQSKELPPFLRQYISQPSIFSLFPRHESGAIYSDVLFTYAFELRNQIQTRFDFACLDLETTGYLSEKEMVEYCRKYKTGEDNENNDQVYLAVMVRKFMFFLETTKKKSFHHSSSDSERPPHHKQQHSEKLISIKKLMSSSILTEFKNSTKEGGSDPNNWFSEANIITLYTTFRELDEDENKFLSREEFARFGGSRQQEFITKIVVDRVFECYVTKNVETNPNSQLDFRTFLDFILAFQTIKRDRERGTSRELFPEEIDELERALSYFWTILDLNHTGYLTIFTMNTFLRDVLSCLRLNEADIGIIEARDVVNEIFDIISPQDPSKITYQDLLNCKLHSTVISMLTNPAAFYAYEVRERTYQNMDEEAHDEELLDAQAAATIFENPQEVSELQHANFENLV